MRRTIITLSVACALTSFQPPQTFGEEPGPQLELHTAGNQTTFRIGERIPLELSFTAPDNSEFQLTLASYDRSGRMEYEKFEVTPATGWADPLTDYFSSGAFMGGGLRGSAPLSSKPTITPLNLNEWVRFDQPGVYHLTISSSRAAPANQPFGHPSPHPPITSNTVELHIVPATDDWQRSKLATILNELAANPAPPGTPPNKRTEAIADLRFLGTPAAIEFMASNLREDRPDLIFQCAFGLMGLRDSMRGIALTAMNRQIDDPHFPISSWFFTVMPVIQSGHTTTARAHEEERKRFAIADWQSVLQALPRKDGKARADTAQTLLSFQPAELTPQIKAQLATVLSSSFLDLTEERQTMQLIYNWDLLRSPAMLPTLQTLATKPLKKPGSNESTFYNRRDLKAAAFRRWYELDPEGAYREILAEIGSSKPSLTAGAVSFLPKQTLPQFEGIWAEAFLTSTDYQEQTVLASLLARFGTGAAASQIATEASKRVGEWACAPQAAALGYLVKFAPDLARPLLQSAVEARGPGKTACNHALFQEISTYASDPVLTEAAVATLDDPDTEIPTGALIYLTSYGDKTVEKPIWDRYLKWSEQWNGREDVLDTQQAGFPSNYQEIGLGENLAHALIANQAWLADAALISKVLQRCIGEQMCRQLKQLAAVAGPPYNVTLNRFNNTENHQIAQYTAKSLDLLEAKIAQFPRGTDFVLVPTSPRTNDQKALEEEAAAIFKRQGMTLHTPSPPTAKPSITSP